MKKCSRCKKNKVLSEYNRAGKSADGRQSRCRACFKELYYEKHGKTEVLAKKNLKEVIRTARLRAR